MWERLRDQWVYGGFLAGILILVLTPVLGQTWPLGLLLIFLQIPVYMLHQYEEHDADRFRIAFNGTMGGGRDVLTHADVFVINIFGVWGVNAVAFWLAASVHMGLGLIAVYLSVVNGIAHCAQAVALRRYNPGLVTAIVLFFPLGGVTLWVLAGTGAATAADHVIGLVAAIGIHALIMVRALGRRRRLEAAA